MLMCCVCECVGVGTYVGVVVGVVCGGCVKYVGVFCMCCN